MENLMIGNWYIQKYYQYHKRKESEQKKKCVRIDKNAFLSNISDDLEGVELSKEILELNGFDNSTLTKYYTSQHFLDMNGKPFYVYVDSFAKSEDSIKMGLALGTIYIRVAYVHQLQNIMRSLGYTELAIGFKVKNEMVRWTRKD